MYKNDVYFFIYNSLCSSYCTGFIQNKDSVKTVGDVLTIGGRDKMFHFIKNNYSIHEVHSQESIAYFMEITLVQLPITVSVRMSFKYAFHVTGL